ncbi:5'-nucleotidase C-terminal domain-containing protein [Brevibacillus humidisoli]|nr:5'-nucleotidase C-terminal domain-containing protein [Brevibacillus humidisoli]UFJ43317.1 5'-nucleotidase C-terminal domain-containing protein [Brevibacillus humidisoli]
MAVAMLASPAAAAPLQSVNHVDWLVNEALVTGDAKGGLSLERNVSLGEVATVFARLKGASVTPAVSGYWAAPYLAWAGEQGAVTADEASAPNQPASAAKIKEMAKVFGYEIQLADSDTVSRQDFFQALGDAASLHITIGHVNDVHGHIQEDSFNKEYGYAKMATLIKEWRGENDNFLLLDAGDTFQGTIYVNQFQGETVVPILNKLGFDVMAAGNHEFDFGHQQLIKLRDQLEHPILSANISKADGTGLLAPSVIKEIDGETFAIFSLTAEDTPILTHPDNVEGLTFKDPVEVAKATVPELRKQADHVILLSHVGYEVDKRIAENVDGIDLIIGGHSHTALKTPEKVNDTYILQDWEYGKSIGRADLFYYNDELVAFSGGLVEYDETVTADPEVDQLVQEVVQKVDESMNVVIAKSEVALDGDRNFVRKRETNVGNLITDIMLERTQSIPGYEADVALTNGGGIRTQLDAGDITKKDLYSLLPFPNTLAVVEVTGEELKQALENGVSQVEEGAGRFPQISGMSFSYDPKKPAGERVVEVKVGDEPLDLNKTYKVATNDFIAAGGDGYESLKKEDFFNTGLTLYSVMEEALIQKKVVNPQVEGRIVEVQ